MSGIAGIIHFDGAPIEPGLIEKMTSAMAHRGPDGIHHWIKGSVALGQCMLRTTPESLEEHQPLANENDSLVLVMDGRVDNREELQNALRGKGITPRDDTDTELVLRAYEAWGGESPKRILGDFAYAIWDGRQRKLFCARDTMGVRPLYYYDGGDFFLIASEMHQLFRDIRVPKEPNLGMVAEYLAAEIVTREETLFKGIQRLAPGHTLSIRAGRLVVSRYWVPNLGILLNYPSEDQYIDHFIEIFKLSMRSKMRSTGSVGVRMSGGLDSTTVLGMAKEMIRVSDVSTVKLETFSTVFPGEDCDETDYIKTVNDFWRTESNLVKRWIAPPPHYIDHARFYLDCPDTPNGVMNTPLKERVRDKGIRVLLTGCGGDEWFWGRDVLYADLIKSIRFRDLAKLYLADERNLRQKIKTFLRYGLWPLLPKAIQSPFQRIAGQHRGFPWITQALLRDSSLEDRIRASCVDNVAFASFDQEAVYQVSTNAWMASNAEIEDLTSSRFGIEQRHPLWDRRIIEFALALPGTLRWRPPYHKYILREAARGLLPETVRLRRDKTRFNSVFPSAIEMQGGERRMSSLILAEIGWIDAKKTLEMAVKVLSANQSNSCSRWAEYIWPVWMAYSMDVWLGESGLITR